jgi:hypothetical protein
MKWITRRNVKVDRVACPWLISRFVDREARFLFVDEGELLEAARREEAVPFDAPRIPEVKLNHRGEHCSFEAILADFKLQDSALHRMALIIRAADIRGQEGIAAEGRGCVCWRRVSARWVCPMNNAWHCNFRCMTHCMHSLKKKGLRIMEPRKLEGLDCKRYTKKGVAWLAAVILLAANIALAQNTSSPSEGVGRWKQVEEAMGRPGQPQPGDVIRFGMPRKDLQVTLDGVQIKPGLALGSWVAFKQDAGGAMVMGDLVITEDEVEPVMMKLQEGGIHESAVHNHLIRESPHVMYMHIASHGDAVQMATAIHEALALTKTPGPDASPAAPPATDLGFDQKQVEQILGHSGKVNGGVLQFGVPRSETITDSGMAVPPSMGVATALNFQPTGNGKAAITGDFVLLGSEVNPVIKALRQNGIAVTALHSHMLMEEPRLFFMHFWANDDALKLAKGLRAALDNTNSAK